MDLMEVLRQTGGVSAIANQLGIPPALAEAGAGALLPAVVGGFSKHAEANGGGEGGLGSLIGMLQGMGGGALASNVLGAEPTNVDTGNSILGQIFGSKDVSRSVAGSAAGQSGIDPALLKKMLPILAMLVGGYLSHHASAAPAEGGTIDQGGGALGGLGSLIGAVLGGGQSAAPAASAGPLGNLGGLASMLDMNHDGNPLDDIIGMAGKFIR